METFLPHCEPAFLTHFSVSCANALQTSTELSFTLNSNIYTGNSCTHPRIYWNKNPAAFLLFCFVFYDRIVPVFTREPDLRSAAVDAFTQTLQKRQISFNFVFNKRNIFGDLWDTVTLQSHQVCPMTSSEVTNCAVLAKLHEESRFLSGRQQSDVQTDFQTISESVMMFWH